MQEFSDSEGSSARALFALLPPDHVDSAELSGSAVQFTVPTGANFVVFSATADFYALYGTNPTAAAPSGTTSDGSGSELNPAVRKVEAASKISVIATSANITLSYYK